MVMQDATLYLKICTPWWSHQMDKCFALFSFCEGNLLFTSGIPSQRPVVRSFGGFFVLHLNKLWANNRDASDLIHHPAHYDVPVMTSFVTVSIRQYTVKKVLIQSLQIHLFWDSPIHPNILVPLTQFHDDNKMKYRYTNNQQKISRNGRTRKVGNCSIIKWHQHCYRKSG